MRTTYSQIEAFSEKLGARIRTQDHGVRAFVSDLACRMLSIKAFDGMRGTLLLGGSFARGEPCIRLIDGAYTLYSDLDLVHIVENQVASIGGLGIRKLLESVGFKDVSFFRISVSEFSQLQTSVGYDFKKHGLCLFGNNEWANTKVEVSICDASDILLFAIQEFFEQELFDRHDSLVQQDEYVLHRIAINAVRSVCMLRGGYFCSDCSQSDSPYASSLLKWRFADLQTKPLSLQDCIDCVQGCLNTHRVKGHLARYTNTIDGSPLEKSQYSAELRQSQLNALRLWDQVQEKRWWKAAGRTRSRAGDVEIGTKGRVIDPRSFRQNADRYRFCLFQAKVGY